MFCGNLLTALGSSESIVGPRGVDRFDPVALWTAVTAYVEGRAGSGKETVDGLSELFTAKYEPGPDTAVHVHLAMLLEMCDCIVKNNPTFTFQEKLTMAVLMISMIPQGPGSFFKSVIAALMMELSKPRNTVDVPPFIAAQLGRCERDHRQLGLPPLGVALMMMARGRCGRGAARGGRPPTRWPLRC